MLLDFLNAGVAIATAAMALKHRRRIGLLFFLAAPNFLGIATYFVAPFDRSRTAVTVSIVALILAFMAAGASRRN